MINLFWTLYYFFINVFCNIQTTIKSRIRTRALMQSFYLATRAISLPESAIKNALIPFVLRNMSCQEDVKKEKKS